MTEIDEKFYIRHRWSSKDNWHYEAPKTKQELELDIITDVPLQPLWQWQIVHEVDNKITTIGTVVHDGWDKYIKWENRE